LEDFKELVELPRREIAVAMTGTWRVAPENVEHQIRNIQWNWVLAHTNDLEPINLSARDVGFAKILNAHGA
jgi:hypothetical protein